MSCTVFRATFCMSMPRRHHLAQGAPVQIGRSLKHGAEYATVKRICARCVFQRLMSLLRAHGSTLSSNNAQAFHVTRRTSIVSFLQHAHKLLDRDIASTRFASLRVAPPLSFVAVPVASSSVCTPNSFWRCCLAQQCRFPGKEAHR